MKSGWANHIQLHAAPDISISDWQAVQRQTKFQSILLQKTDTLQAPGHHWLGKLSNLNAARTESRGIAPHKPLMLLTVIDLIEIPRRRLPPRLLMTLP